LLRRIDETHANPKQLWQSWGSPDYLHAKQVDQLKLCAMPVATPVQLKLAQSSSKSGSQEPIILTLSVQLDLPAFGLAVLDVNLTRGAGG
jgi:hypothetical protein